MKIGIIGAGNIARAIVIGLISDKTRPDKIMVSDPNEKKIAELNRYGIKKGTNEQVVKFADVLILAVKPNVYEEVLPEVADAKKLVVSIAAGISLDYIKGFLGDGARVVRVMPNTPALAGAGMTAVCADGAADSDLETVKSIFSSLGKVLVTTEKYIDAVCGVSGSGPAYVFTMIDAMADGGVACGLTKSDAVTLAAQTVFGSAKLLLETGMHPAELRDMVCSPGGTTIDAVKALEQNGFRAALIEAVEAACEKSKILKK